MVVVVKPDVYAICVCSVVVPNSKNRKMDSIEIIYDILPETGPVAFEFPELNVDHKTQLENELKDISSSIEIKSENIGAGADWIVVIVSIAGIFFLGEKINKNLEAWISLSKRFISLLKQTKASFIDSSGAKLIAIEKILKNEKYIDSIEEVAFTEINLQDLTRSFTDGRKPTELRSKPLCYYSMIFRVNGFAYYMLGIKSNGEVKTFDKIEESQFGFYKEYKLEK